MRKNSRKNNYNRNDMFVWTVEYREGKKLKRFL